MNKGVGSVLKHVSSERTRRGAGTGKLRFVDMFAGIGGFHIALSNLGCECVFACDIDDEARRAYAENFKLVPHGDISSINPKEIPAHDIFCAGFPCQPFSIIGKRNGFADNRGVLIFDIARILKHRRPKAIILENVKQLATHNGGKTFAKMREVLVDIGYTINWRVLDARDFGLPHKRERLIIVGFKGRRAGFEFPIGGKAMKPLCDILEPDEIVDKKHFVSQRIRASRQAKHKAKDSPSIWHENKGGNISSHPFSCALRAGASYNYLLVNGVRRLTSREMLRLQGFPDNYRIVCNDSQTRKQAGNAVPVNIIQAVAREVQNVLTTNKNRQADAL